jgi:hypothetical protein
MIAARRPRASKAIRSASAVAPPTAPPDPAGPHVVARLVPLDPGLYAFSLSADSAWREPVAGLALPAVHLCAPPRQDGAVEITDGSGRTGSWLGGRDKVLFVRSPPGGGAALVTGYLSREPDSLLELEIRRIAPPGPAILALRLGGAGAADRAERGGGLDIVAHIRGRGDVPFLDTQWVGRLGPGMWIEGFTVHPHGGLATAAIEYKGLAASGAETPWIDGGDFCGTRGRGIPLIGFAVRQKAVPSGVALDCEYTGYFQSGATVGPVRNGAPCRSGLEQDALEGIQLRVTPRPPADVSTK